MLSITAFIAALQQKENREKSQKDFEAYVSTLLPKDFNEDVASDYEEAAKDVIRGFRSLTEDEKKERREMYELATKTVGPAMYKMLAGMNNAPEIESVDRAFQAMFFGMGNETEDIERKKDMMHVLKSGTAQERHDLFLETMDRMAQFPLEEFRALSDKEKIRRMGEFLPMLQIGMEGENLLKEFKNLNCGITADEETQFTAMFAELNVENMALTQKLDMMINPFYPAIDFTQLPVDDNLCNKLDETVQQRYIDDTSSIHELSTASKFSVRNEITPIRMKAGDEFKAAGLVTKTSDIQLCNAKGKYLKKDEFRQRDKQWLKEGKTVYYANRYGDKQVMAFRDLLGNGVLTRYRQRSRSPTALSAFSTGSTAPSAVRACSPSTSITSTKSASML